MRTSSSAPSKPVESLPNPRPTAAEGIATASSPLLNTLREREKELDRLDMEIDDGVTDAITQVSASEARELLACMKFMIGLERIGDLLLSFANSAHAAGGRLDPQDIRELTQMATLLEKMLTDVGDSFSTRDAKWYLKVSFWLLCFSLWHSILVLQRRMAIRCADDTELFLID